jgi:hypothetical protein
MPCRRLAPRVALALVVGVLLLGSLSPSSALAASCAPRPPVGVTVTPTGPQYADLAVTLTAGSTPGQPNQLDSVRFNAIQDARIDAGSRLGETRTFAVSLPAGTDQFSFVVHPERAGVPPSVHLVVDDACGAWPTFVGGTGGPSAPSAVSCLPRPPVLVTTRPLDPDTLEATLRVTGTHNALQVLELGTVSNARLTLAERPGDAVAEAVTLPAQTEQVTLTVQRQGAGPYGVALTAVDGCGRWPTFLGTGGFPPSEETPVSCEPRPAVQLTTVAGDSQLVSLIRATGAANRLLAVEFGAATNSRVEVADHPSGPGNFTLGVPTDAPLVSFTLRPLAPDAYSVPLVVVDRCGRWPTLVSAAAAPPPPEGGKLDPNAPTATPELDSFVLFASGALGLGLVAWRRRQSAA